MATKATTRLRKTAYRTVCTHDLSDRALDWAVAAARRMLDRVAPHEVPTASVVYDQAGKATAVAFSPTTNYAQLGPLMDEEGVETFRNADVSRWYASMWRAHRAYAEDRLTSACRSIVLKHLGEAVKVPVALLEGQAR